MRTYLMIVSLAMAAPAAAEECTPDKAAFDLLFKDAYKEILDYQTFAHLCGPSIGSAHAQFGVTMIEVFLMRSGLSRSDAVILADKTDKAAIQRAEKSDFASKLSAINAKTIEVMNACMEEMNGARHRYDVAEAKMIQAGCIPD